MIPKDISTYIASAAATVPFILRGRLICSSGLSDKKRYKNQRGADRQRQDPHRSGDAQSDRCNKNQLDPDANAAYPDFLSALHR